MPEKKEKREKKPKAKKPVKKKKVTRRTAKSDVIRIRAGDPIPAGYAPVRHITEYYDSSDSDDGQSQSEEYEDSEEEEQEEAEEYEEYSDAESESEQSESEQSESEQSDSSSEYGRSLSIFLNDPDELRLPVSSDDSVDTVIHHPPPSPSPKKPKAPIEFEKDPPKYAKATRASTKKKARDDALRKIAPPDVDVEKWVDDVLEHGDSEQADKVKEVLEEHPMKPAEIVQAKKEEAEEAEKAEKAEQAKTGVWRPVKPKLEKDEQLEKGTETRDRLEKEYLELAGKLKKDPTDKATAAKAVNTLAKMYKWLSDNYGKAFKEVPALQISQKKRVADTTRTYSAVRDSIKTQYQKLYRKFAFTAADF